MIIIYIVSACLAGVKCKYNGESNKNDTVCRLVKEGRAIALCPEVLGGLPIPRVPCEIIYSGNKRKVLNRDGQDVTENFVTGAKKTLEIAKLVDAKVAILKSKSPSCGFGKIYDGTFSGRLIDGNGVTSQLLVDNGIQVYTENEVDKL